MKQNLTLRRTAIIAALVASLLPCMAVNKCGGTQNNFVTGLRLALVASPAFLDSLGLGDKREAVANDFLALGNDALTFGDELKACTDNPCRVEAVNHFQTKFWDVLRGGHFKLSEKLQRIQKIIQGIVDSARIFYGGPAPASITGAARPVTEADLKAQVEALKAAMKEEK